MRILLIVSLFCTSAQAELYTCKVNGKTTLTDVPCRSNKGRSEIITEEDKTAAQIQAEFEREIADKRAAEIAKAESEKKAEQERQKKASENRHYVEMAPTRAAQGAAQIKSAMRDPDSLLRLSFEERVRRICVWDRHANWLRPCIQQHARIQRPLGHRMHEQVAHQLHGRNKSPRSLGAI